MPFRLIERLQPDSIREFRTSARQRYTDGLALSAAGNRTAAVYLWGYTAEMMLKAAYFGLLGIPSDDPITMAGHIRPAIHRGRAAPFHIAWPNRGEGHNVRAWAELLIAARATDPATAYAPDFAFQVQTCGQTIGQLWNETLRYHKNVAYLHEVRRVRQAADWMCVYSLDL